MFFVDGMATSLLLTGLFNLYNSELVFGAGFLTFFLPEKLMFLLLLLLLSLLLLTLNVRQ